MSFFGFGQSVEVEIVLSDAESRKRAEHKTEDGKKEKYFLFYDGETVSGKVSLALKHPNKRLEHQGIKIEFIGQIGESRPGPPSPAASASQAPARGEVQRAGAARVMPVEPFVPCGLRPARPPWPVALQSSLPKGVEVPSAQRRPCCCSWWVPCSRVPQLSLHRVAQLGFLPPGFRSEMRLP